MVLKYFQIPLGSLDAFLDRSETFSMSRENDERPKILFSPLSSMYWDQKEDFTILLVSVRFKKLAKYFVLFRQASPSLFFKDLAAKGLLLTRPYPSNFCFVPNNIMRSPFTYHFIISRGELLFYIQCVLDTPYFNPPLFDSWNESVVVMCLVNAFLACAFN